MNPTAYYRQPTEIFTQFESLAAFVDTLRSSLEAKMLLAWEFEWRKEIESLQAGLHYLECQFTLAATRISFSIQNRAPEGTEAFRRTSWWRFARAVAKFEEVLRPVSDCHLAPTFPRRAEYLFL